MDSLLEQDHLTPEVLNALQKEKYNVINEVLEEERKQNRTIEEIMREVRYCPTGWDLK